jgi:hypothetical protein
MSYYPNQSYSINEHSYVNTSNINLNPKEDNLSNSKMTKSFIDNKPMIQGLVRSVLKV